MLRFSVMSLIGLTLISGNAWSGTTRKLAEAAETTDAAEEGISAATQAQLVDATCKYLKNWNGFASPVDEALCRKTARVTFAKVDAHFGTYVGMKVQYAKGRKVTCNVSYKEKDDQVSLKVVDCGGE